MTIETIKYEILGLLRHFQRFSFLYRAPSRSTNILYLTFDDGPNPGITDRLLDLLAQHQVKASFFCIGHLLDSEQALTKRIVAEGHLLSNHSFSHYKFTQLPVAEQIEEVEKTDETIFSLTNVRNRHFRAPYGRWSLSMLLALWKKGKVPVHWSYDSNDYTKKPAAALIQRFLQNPVVNGEIILLHDDAPLCIELLATLIPHWRKAGFSFALLP